MKDLSLSQKQIILGGLLGDSSFYRDKKYVSFSHSEKQLLYLKWKNDFLYKDSHIKKTYSKWNEKQYPKYYFYYYIKNDMDLYSFICKHLYSNEGRKKISLKYLNELTPLGLAVWWMDDGCMCLAKRNRYGKLCTHCFNYEENILIQKYFKKKWDISVSIKMEKGKYFIRFNVDALKKLIKIIYPYVIDVPNMAYKIDLDYTRKKCIGEDFADIYECIKQHINI